MFVKLVFFIISKTASIVSLLFFGLDAMIFETSLVINPLNCTNNQDSILRLKKCWSNFKNLILPEV